MAERPGSVVGTECCMVFMPDGVELLKALLATDDAIVFSTESLELTSF